MPAAFDIVWAGAVVAVFATTFVSTYRRGRKRSGHGTQRLFFSS
jgi:hypothetical protein